MIMSIQLTHLAPHIDTILISKYSVVRTFKLTLLANFKYIIQDY